MKSEMLLKKLNDNLLLQRLTKLVKTERKITHLILACINEIEIRKLHLARGYSSLFDFLTQNLGYSPGSAQRRIDGARLLRQIPEIATKLELGHINLSQVSLLQRSVRIYQAETKKKITLEQKKELLEKLNHQNSKQSEIILAQELNLNIPQQYEKTQHHKDESVSVTIHFSKTEMELIEQIKHLNSNSTGSLDLKSLVLYLARKEMKKWEKKPSSVKNKEPGIKAKNFTAATAVKPDSKSPLKRKTYRQILKPNSHCMFKDPNTNRQCKSKVYLNVDHIKPRWAFRAEEITSGEDDVNNVTDFVNNPENLQVLCANHNKFRYRKQSYLK